MKKQPEENPIRTGVINRYQRSLDTGPDDEDCDVVYHDRLSGREVMRYDGGDPANKPPLGPSDEDCFLRKGLDINEEVELSRCRMPVSAEDVAAYHWRQAQVLEKQQQIDNGVELLGELDLWSYLEIAYEDFDFGNWSHDEKTVLQPAFERKGFSRVSFFMGEQDRSGPLSRGIRAWKDNKGYIFYYG